MGNQRVIMDIMPQLTIKQAVDYTGKSENTLRRLLKKYSKTTHEYSKFFYKKGGKYYIDKDFLKRHYHVAEGEQQKELDLSIVSHLKEQNKELNSRVKELTHIVAHQSQQLVEKDNQIRLLSSPVQHPLKTEKGKEHLVKTFFPLLIVLGALIGVLIAFLIGIF